MLNLNREELLRRLIAEPSVSSVDSRYDQSNAGVIALLAEWFETLGFGVEVMDVAVETKKHNLIARLGSGTDGLVLAGHTDTVPFDDTGWHSDPFVLTERRDRYYGLGSADMKSFFPAVIDALQRVGPKTLTKPLTIIATADEESSMAGVKAIAATRQQLGHYAVIGEPTALTPICMHKGIILESIRLLGQAGHASNPALGRNAIDGMTRVLEALMRWRDELAQHHRNDRFAVPGPTLNFGNIHGGDSPNRICAHCELQVDMRLLPDMSFEAVRANLRQRVERAIEGLQLELEMEALGSGGVPPMMTPANARIVTALEHYSGRSAGAVAFATEGPFLNDMGMETVIFGAGDIAQAHQANEYVEKQSIATAASILADLIKDFCR